MFTIREAYFHDVVPLFEYVIIIIIVLNVAFLNNLRSVLISEVLVLVAARQLQAVTDPGPGKINLLSCRKSVTYLMKDPMQMTKNPMIKTA